MLINPEVFDLGNKIRAVYVPVEGFKTSLITISLLVPRENNLAENIILPRYLTYCSEKYPLPTDLSARCESLYGTVISGSVARKGESSRVELSATCIDNRFAFDGEDIAGSVLELMLELLFNPLSSDGRLSEEPFRLQQRLAVERIESEAFVGLRELYGVYIPETVISIADDAFDSSVVIIAPADSFAAAWAESHGFQIMSD